MIQAIVTVLTILVGLVCCVFTVALVTVLRQQAQDRKHATQVVLGDIWQDPRDPTRIVLVKALDHPLDPGQSDVGLPTRWRCHVMQWQIQPTPGWYLQPGAVSICLLAKRWHLLARHNCTTVRGIRYLNRGTAVVQKGSRSVC